MVKLYFFVTIALVIGIGNAIDEGSNKSFLDFANVLMADYDMKITNEGLQVGDNAVLEFSEMSDQSREALLPDEVLVESETNGDYSDKLASLDNNIIQMATEAGFNLPLA